MLIRIFCDGASANNQNADLRVGGYGGLVFINRNGETYKKEVSGREDGATNNAMELMAIYRSLEAVPVDWRATAKVHIQSDSAYCVGIFNDWIEGWRKKNWKKKGGIKNLELVKSIDSLMGQFEKINIEHVPRNSNDWMTRADELASIAAGSLN